MRKIKALTKDVQLSCSSTSHHVKMQNKGLHQTRCWHFNLECPSLYRSSELFVINFPVLGILLQKLKLTKTGTIHRKTSKISPFVSS
jgi:hypothetical protein